jgi:Effector Associated Constant Component 1
MNEVVFEFGGSEAEADGCACALTDWLNDTEDLRGCARVRTVPPLPGEQGGAADAVLVIAALTPLAEPFFGWLTEWVKSRSVSVVITRSDGTSLNVTAATSAQATALEPLVRGFVDPPGSG